MKKTSMKIEGMSCSACANRIERVVNKLDGVEKGSVNFAAETLALEYNEEKVKLDEVEAAIEKAGFKVKKNIKDYTFKVEGMTCSACANRVEKVTQKIEGVESASVNFATEQLTVKLDADLASYGQIKSAVEKAGFQLISESDTVQPQEKKRDEATKLLTRFIISLIFSLHSLYPLAILLLKLNQSQLDVQSHLLSFDYHL